MEIIFGIFIGVVISVIAFYSLFDTDKLKKQNLLIIQKLNTMPTKAEFDALRDEIQTGLTNIADDITRLTDQLENGDLSAEDEAAVFADLRALADRTREIGARTPEAPEPEEPEA